MKSRWRVDNFTIPQEKNELALLIKRIKLNSIHDLNEMGSGSDITDTQFVLLRVVGLGSEIAVCCAGKEKIRTTSEMGRSLYNAESYQK